MNQEPKIFLSYTRKDSAFALKLAKQLKSANINIWMDKLDIRPGTIWDEEVEKALEKCKTLLFLASETSVSSLSVLNEVNFAIEENKTVVPVLIENCKLPFRIRRLQRIDMFSNYEEGFNDLIKELKSTQDSKPDDPAVPAHQVDPATPAPGRNTEVLTDSGEREADTALTNAGNTTIEKDAPGSAFRDRNIFKVILVTMVFIISIVVWLLTRNSSGVVEAPTSDSVTVMAKDTVANIPTDPIAVVASHNKAGIDSFIKPRPDTVNREAVSDDTLQSPIAARMGKYNHVTLSYGKPIRSSGILLADFKNDELLLSGELRITFATEKDGETNKEVMSGRFEFRGRLNPGDPEAKGYLKFHPIEGPFESEIKWDWTKAVRLLHCDLHPDAVMIWIEVPSSGNSARIEFTR